MMFGYIRSYLQEYMPEIRNFTDNTIALYQNTLTMYLKFAAAFLGMKLDSLDFTAFDEPILKAFLMDKKNSGCSPKTCNIYLNTLRAFIRYASTRDITLTSLYNKLAAVPHMKEPTDLTVRYFGMATLNALLSSIDKSTASGRRNFIYLYLLYDTACRVNEIIMLNIRNVILDTTSPYIIVTGKGRKIRNVPVSKQMASLLRRYMDEFHREHDPEAFLFYPKKSRYESLTYNAVRRVLENTVAKAAERHPEITKDITLHMFRHSRAMHLYENGMQITMIQQLLGHSSVDVTYIYASASIAMKEKAITKATAGNSPISKSDVRELRKAQEKNMSESDFLEHFGLKSKR